MSSVFDALQLQRIAQAIEDGYAGGGTLTVDVTGAGDMQGASSGTPGVHGLVPAPQAGDQDKVLTGAGTWEDPPASGGVDYSTSEQDTGLKWIDGRSIYQRTFQNIALNHGSWTNGILGTSSIEIIDYSGKIAISGTSRPYCQLDYYRSTAEWCTSCINTAGEDMEATGRKHIQFSLLINKEGTMKIKTAKQRKAIDNATYDVESVPSGYRYWRTKLLNYTLGIFRWSGLPESVPWRELELNLQLRGHAVFCINSRTDEMVIPITELYGFDEYYRPTGATFGNVLIPFKRLEFGINSDVIYNDRIRGNVLREQWPDSGLASFISRYARLLADVESTVDTYLINMRARSYMVAKNQAMATQLNDFQRRIALGERAVITDEDILEAFRNVDIVGSRGDDRINDLLIARDKILSMFFRDIGVKFEQEQKKAQLTEDEVTADEQLLLINIDDMLQERREGAERVNKLFGLSLSVEINPAYDRRGKSGESPEKDPGKSGESEGEL